MADGERCWAEMAELHNGLRPGLLSVCVSLLDGGVDRGGVSTERGN